MKKVIISIFITIGVIATASVYAYFKGKPVNVEINKKVEDLPQDISDIIYHASLAPNSHNTQLWKVSINKKKNTLKINLDTDRTLKQVDSNNREAYISMGAFTANLLQSFKAYGYETKVILNTDSSEPVTVSYIKTEKFTKDETILDLIKKRHTDKSTYLDKEINNDDIKTILNNNTHYFKRGDNEFKYLKTAEIEAMTKQSYNKAKAEEFAEWLRFSDKEAEDKKDGLPAEQLGLKGIKKTLYYLTTSNKSAKGISFAKQSIDTTTKQVENCAGFLVITGGTSRKELIETGINLENIWLSAVKKGISVHPMSQILEEKPYSSEVDKMLHTKSPVQMILRVGYVKDYGTNNQIRRNLSDYVTVEK